MREYNVILELKVYNVKGIIREQKRALESKNVVTEI